MDSYLGLVHFVQEEEENMAFQPPGLETRPGSWLATEQVVAERLGPGRRPTDKKGVTAWRRMIPFEVGVLHRRVVSWVET
jgi:hypothetical protein